MKSPDEDDWGKLRRVLKYSNGTKYLKLITQPWNFDVVKWYMDALYAIQMDRIWELALSKFWDRYWKG